MKRLIQFLKATGRSIRRFFAKIMASLLDKTSFTLKITVKLPLIFEAELIFKTDFTRSEGR